MVERGNGKAGFLRFAFENPRRAQQAYELGAFGIDNDTDGNEFVLDVVMTASPRRRSRAPRSTTSPSSRSIEVACAAFPRNALPGSYLLQWGAAGR